MNSFGEVGKALQRKQSMLFPKGCSLVRSTGLCKEHGALEKLQKGERGWMGWGRKDNRKKGVQREG